MPTDLVTVSELPIWSKEQVDGECREAHVVYDSELTRHYAEYFAHHPDLRGEQFFSARDLTAALPPGWGRLAELLPPSERHRHHLSGKSSQTLALGLFGVASRRDPSLSWITDLAPGVPVTGRNGAISFEVGLSPEVLGERPRQTSIDLLIETDDVAIVTEVKWREAGLGSCSCEQSGGDPRVGRCSRAVLERASYWQAAEESLGLPGRADSFLCPISLGYQAVRNVAAVRALRGDRLGVFALVYDENNPYFHRTGRWPGWPTVLADSLTGGDVAFAAISWQQLATRLPLDAATREWARRKHRLG